MKQLTFFSKFFVLAIALSFWASCNPDDGTGGGGGFILGPTTELKSGVDLTSSDATVSAGEIFKVNVSVSKGDNDMTTFTVLEDGLAIDASRLNYNGAGAGALSNPYTLTAGEAEFFDTNIEIMAHLSGDASYTFRMSDSAGESDETTITISVPSTPLSLGFESANGGIVTNATLPNQTNFKVELLATQGGSLLSTLTVLENGTEVDASRIKFGVDNDFASASDFFSNPLDLVNDEKNGFNWFVWVNSHDSGTSTYTYRLTDELGATEDLTLDITISSGTPVAELSGKLLLNSAGMTGQGGINLLTGEQTGSGTTQGGHLKDNGINLLAPAVNWMRTISPIGNNTLRIPGTDFPVDDFAAVQYSEEIQVAFENGDNITTTGLVSIGDRYLMQLITGEYVLILVTNIEETVDNNNDSYTLSIKY